MPQTMMTPTQPQPNRHDRRHQPETDQPELLTKTDVAKMFQMSGRQVENLVRLKKMPEPIRLGTHPRWRRAELMNFLDSVSNPASQAAPEQL